jgi:hypothetical protein
MPSLYAPLLIASAVALAAGAAQAQSASTALPGVTVEGAAKPKVIEQQARRFTETFAAPTVKIGQVARWHEPVCVQVEGVIPAQADQIKARVEEVAKDVGVPVEKPGCASNIQIVFTSEPQGLIEKVAKRDERLLGFHYREDLKKVKAVTRPIQSWYETATQRGGGNRGGIAFAKATDATGQPITNPGTGVLPGQAAGGGDGVDSPDSLLPIACGDNPHFTSCLRSLFRNVLVVVDSRALQGKDLAAVADYVSLLALAQPRSLDGCNSLASIVDMLAKTACPGRDPPDGLTSADAAYLTALYNIDPDAKMIGQLDDLSGRMAKILIGARPSAP